MRSGLAITGLGMVSAVGNGAAGACAAIRAGISRISALHPPVLLMDAESDEPVPAMGHAIAGFTDGFQGEGRLRRLAAGAVHDLRSDLDDAAWARIRARCQLVVCVADDLRERHELEEGEQWDLVGGAFPPGSELAAIEIAGGPDVALRGIEVAAASIESGRADRALVVAVDSLTDQASVEWVAAQHRLKGPDQPTGISPGEAAACLLLEDPRVASRRGARPLATVVALATREAEQTEPPQLGAGRAVAAALVAALGPDRRTGCPADAIVSLNGEATRAGAWGLSLPLVRMTHALDPRLILPAVAIGDVGAAFSAVAGCVAARAFERGYATSQEILVVALSDHGSATACVLRAPGVRVRG